MSEGGDRGDVRGDLADDHTTGTPRVQAPRKGLRFPDWSPFSTPSPSSSPELRSSSSSSSAESNGYAAFSRGEERATRADVMQAVAMVTLGSPGISGWSGGAKSIDVVGTLLGDSSMIKEPGIVGDVPVSNLPQSAAEPWVFDDLDVSKRMEVVTPSPESGSRDDREAVPRESTIGDAIHNPMCSDSRLLHEAPLEERIARRDA